MLALRELIDASQHFIEQPLGADAAVAHHCIQPLGAVHLSLKIVGLGNAIGIEQNLIARNQLDTMIRILRLGINA